MQPPRRDAPHAGNAERDDSDDGLRKFRIGVAVGALVVLIAGVVARFDYDLTLPGKPPPPPPPDSAALRRMDYENPDIYKAYLEQDSTTYGVSRTEPAELAAPFPYEKTEASRALAPGGPAIDTGMLRISARVEKLDVHTRKGKSAAEHLVLRIENKRQRPVAYRVQTTFGAGSDASCGAKGSLPHNAMAIPANGSVERTECFYRAKMVVTVEQIEAMELPPLSFFYVSRIYPPHIGAQARTSANHETPAGAACTTVPQQSILIGMEKGTVSWRDVVDFYARHRCETYDFPLGYRAITQPGQYRLPVSAAQIAALPR
jgi:hypothetical protein